MDSLILKNFGILYLKREDYIMTDFKKELSLRDEIIKSLEHQNELKDKMLEHLKSLANGQDEAIEILMDEVKIKDEIIASQEKNINTLNEHTTKLEELIKQILSPNSN